MGLYLTNAPSFAQIVQENNKAQGDSGLTLE